MYKLVIMIEPVEDQDAFEQRWPEFLHLVEALPGLRREASSRIDRILYGAVPVQFMHELFFDSHSDAVQALETPAGREAGKLLQQMTAGKVALFFADHKEDEGENIRRYRGSESQHEPA